VTAAKRGLRASRVQRALLVLCLGGQEVPTLPVDVARDVTGEGMAFVETEVARGTYFVHEPIRVRVRFGFEERFLRDEVIQLFRRELDVPAQLQASWLQDPGSSDDEDVDPTRPSFALDGGVARGARRDVVRDGRRFTVLELERRRQASVPGELAIPGPLLRFAYATRFRDDPIRGRVALDRVDAFVRGEGLALRIQALPEEGRPPDYGGAVGRFAVSAAADPRDVEVGQTLELVLHIEGEGNLGSFHAPRLHGLDGFRVLGTIEEEGEGALVATYDLAPHSERVDEVPAIRFTFFEPPSAEAGADVREAGYRTVETRPIPIVVRPRAPETPAATAAPRPEGPRRSFPAGALGVLVASALALLALFVWIRMRTRGRPLPARARVARAVAAFRARAADPRADVADAYTELLAACLDRPPAAVVSRDLARHLEAIDVPAELAERAEPLLAELTASRYGGPESEHGARAVRAWVDELAASPAVAR